MVEEAANGGHGFPRVAGLGGEDEGRYTNAFEPAAVLAPQQCQGEPAWIDFLEPGGGFRTPGARARDVQQCVEQAAVRADDCQRQAAEETRQLVPGFRAQLFLGRSERQMSEQGPLDAVLGQRRETEAHRGDVRRPVREQSFGVDPSSVGGLLFKEPLKAFVRFPLGCE
jgi:hypothetical protein